ncbi:hypothetical protein EJ110_NYTH49651 [Nymphaea thermarum]|nr:hypothetical protein EJ110_NYTH49651 [Nymphaea thermarum]
MPEGDRVNYGTYLLKGDAKNWWQSTREIRYTGQLSISWKQFRDSFFSTYFRVHARDKKMQEFLDLQQNQMSLKEYITRYRHLEVYCPHLYTTDGTRAGKFVRGLRDGLRSKVLTSRPHDLDEAVTMARCIKEDWARTQKDHHKKAGQYSHERVGSRSRPGPTTYPWESLTSSPSSLSHSPPPFVTLLAARREEGDGGGAVDGGDRGGPDDGGGGADCGGDEGTGGGVTWMEYQRRGKKRVELSTEAQREPSPAHSDAHTPQEDNTSGQQNAQASVGAQTPPRQTPPVDQQALLLTTLQTLTSIVQSMAGNQRSQTSPTGDTTAPPKEKATTVTFHHFMTMQPPVFTGDGSPDKTEEWIEEIERIFEQNHLSLEEYITKYRHLEAYCPHLHTTAEARADKFVYGLRDGIRSRVMSGSPHNLDEAVTMARRMEEDWVRTQRDHQKKTSQHTQGGRMPVKHHHPAGRARPYERRDDRTFRRNRPGRGETTQGSVASPTSPRCPTCSHAHPGKPCYRMTGACLHCGVKAK